MVDYFSFGYIVGYFGILLGLLVAPPQLIKIVKSKAVSGISLHTYIFLCCALVAYLIHAIYIGSVVFQIAQAVNLTTNGIILVLLIKYRAKGR